VLRYRQGSCPMWRWRPSCCCRSTRWGPAYASSTAR